MKKKTKRVPIKRTSPLDDTLHSWTINTWPLGVWPNDPERARHICRVHRSELVEDKALVRINQELVILSEGYTKWLGRPTHSKRVKEYEIAPNKPEHAAKRNGADHQREEMA